MAAPRKRTSRAKRSEAAQFSGEVGLESVDFSQSETVPGLDVEVSGPGSSAPVPEAPAPAPEASVPPPPERHFLGRAGNARLYVTQGGGHPLDLAVDAVVIPTDFRAEFSGTFASHARSILGSGWEFFESAVRPRLVDDVLPPEKPVFQTVERSGRPALTLIAATPWEITSGTRTATLEGVEQAVQAVIARTKGRAIHRLAIPLMGTRGGGLTPVRVARTLLATAQSALPAAPWIHELTVIAQEDDAYQEAVTLFTRAPQQFANDLPGGDDLLDVAGEVQALTDILLLKSLQPPLAVGVLGGWGSGKSFALELMRRHIQRIRSLPPRSRWDEGQPGDYVGHIYPITFDAWTYAKSNLWASLMQTIFLELSRQVRLEQRLRARETPLTDELEGNLWLAFQGMTDRDREFLSQHGIRDIRQEQLDGEAGKALWEAVARARAKDKETLDKKQQEMAEKATEIEKKRSEFERKVDQELADRAYQIAWNGAAPALRKLVEKVVKETPGADSAAADGKAVKEFLHQTGEDLHSIPLGFRSFREALGRNPLVIAMVVLVSLACGGLAWKIHQSQREIALAIAWLGPVLSLLAGVAKTASSWRARIAGAWKTLDQEVRSAQARVERERDDLRERLQASSEEAKALRELEEQQRRLVTEIQALRQQIGFTADYISVADLVQSRLTKAEYEGELGPLHRVQRDLQELSEALCPSSDPEHLDKLQKQFPRGPARIVLFIDDLDRCPPDRVVEVLEAVQLLVKTPLFVVVLAMDVRYITRALEKVYKDILLRRGRPSGLDYIEKIIQLPYSVRPIDAAHVERFLRGQMEVQAEPEPNLAQAFPSPFPSGPAGASGSPTAPVEETKPVTPEVVAFTADELDWLRSYCQALPLSPRAVKRVVNALKLLKIVWFRPNRHIRPEPTVQQSFVALLALSAAYPDAMRVVFSMLSERIRDQTLPDLQAELTTVLDSEQILEACAPEEIEDLRQKATLVPVGAQLPPHLRTTLELVRSLSFVAEIGYDPADLREALDTRKMLRVG